MPNTIRLISLEELKKGEWSDALSEPLHRAVQVYAIGEPASELLAVQHLDWDSKILGLRTGRIAEMVNLNPTPSESYVPLIEQLERQGYEYLTVRCKQSEWGRIHRLEDAGFRSVDGILTFSKKLEGSSQDSQLLPAARRGEAEDALRLGDLAVKTFSLSRFHNDPLLTKEQADRIHWEWAKNTCLGIAGKVAWLIESEKEIIGFVTCKMDGTVGTIDLIGVSPKAVGRGLGQDLVKHAGAWFFENGCSSVRVQTQSDNLAAIRLYLKCGFAIVDTGTTLRWKRPLV